MLSRWSRFCFASLAVCFVALQAQSAIGQTTEPVGAEQAYAEGLASLKSGQPEKAAGIWEDLALAGSAKAQYSLALLLETGQGGFRPDLEKAVRFYTMAADAGIAEAQTNLGLLYAQGAGVNKNSALAVKYWRKSAASGHPMALFNLGLAFFQGTGVPADRVEAAALVYRASMQNLKEAQFALGQFYRNGVGVTKSEEEAFYWYRLAERQGHEGAGAMAQELKAKGIAFRGAPDPSLKPREAKVFAVAAKEQRPAGKKLESMIAPSGSAGSSAIVKAPTETATLKPFDQTAAVQTPTAQTPVEPARPGEKRSLMLLSTSEAEIAYREALVMLQSQNGDRLDNGRQAANKILSAALAGNSRAQRSLGEMYLLGLDIERDETESLYWIREAGRNGIEDINGFADALELMGTVEPARPTANPVFVN